MVRRGSPLSLGRIVERMAELSAPYHRDLVRAMVSELDSIADPAERRRFAVGAIVAIVRLALSRHRRTTVHAPGRFVGISEPEDGANPGGPTMSKLTIRQLLRRHATPFAVSLASLTILLLARSTFRRLPELSARGVAADAIVEVLLLALPHTLALSIPMAVFLAVSWAFTRLGAEGVLASARRERHGVRRLIAPVLGAAAVIGTLTFVSNTQVLPHTNARLAAVLLGHPLREPSDRTMTIGELREAARIARLASGEEAPRQGENVMSDLRLLFLLVLASIVSACGRPGAQPSSRGLVVTRADLEARLPGCYAFFDHAGRPASDSLYWAPAIGRLDSGGRAAKLGSATTAGRRRDNNNWRVDARTDTVRVLFHSGFSGTEFILGLRPHGDTLRGRAVEHWDFGPPFSNDAGVVSAVRIACPADGRGGASRSNNG
jgi:lipopolysaccharide export system permease LptF/LptG-like protein